MPVFLEESCNLSGRWSGRSRGTRSPRNLCKWLIEPSEVTGVEIATNPHDFESEIKHEFVTEGCFFLWVGRSPAVVDRFFVH